MRSHHTDQIQTNPSADVISQKLLDTAPERKESTQDASTHIQTASSPVATVLAGASSEGAEESGELRRDRLQDGTAKEKDVVHTCSGRKTGDGPIDHGNPYRPENARDVRYAIRSVLSNCVFLSILRITHTRFDRVWRSLHKLLRSSSTIGAFGGVISSKDVQTCSPSRPPRLRSAARRP